VQGEQGGCGQGGWKVCWDAGRVMWRRAAGGASASAEEGNGNSYVSACHLLHACCGNWGLRRVEPQLLCA
jgi:hypothetical protein